jgi:hypothetical protein
MAASFSSKTSKPFLQNEPGALAELPAKAPGSGILPRQRRSGIESIPPFGLQEFDVTDWQRTS